jgi:hypothetical protein
MELAVNILKDMFLSVDQQQTRHLSRLKAQKLISIKQLRHEVLVFTYVARAIGLSYISIS